MKISQFQLLLLRLAVGALFLTMTLDKYNEGWLTNSEPLRTSLQEFHQRAAGAQLTYLEAVAIPYSGIWAKSILIGEGCIAISLILGALVRLTTAAGMLMLLNFYAANGNLFTWKIAATPYGCLLFFSLFALLLARAGRWVGIDAILAKSNAKGLLW